MYTSGITSEYSILDCPQMMPMVIERPNNWKFNKGAEVVAPNCPRCASSNTKFCYYNNYSFSQPRYFCKACRRYWTKGGSLRNVPVGGGCRKSRRSRARQAAGKNGPAPAMSPDAGSTNTSETSSADIDLAAVFAKYVNPNADPNESSSPGASSESYENVPASSSDMDSQVGDVGLMFEYQNQVDWISGVEDQVLPQMCMNQDVSCGQEFVYRNGDHAFEMQQGVLGDDPAAEIWSDVTNLQSFGSQLQEFDLFAPEDQLRIPAGNLTNDTWSSLDLSAYEIF